MQRKSSGNLLGFFFFPCFVYIWSFFPSLCLYCSVSLFFSVSVRFASDFLEIYCLCTVGIARLLMWFLCGLYVEFIAAKLTGRRRGGRRRIFRCHWNRKRNSPKCMEIIAAIIPKSYGIKEAYNRITVKSNAFSSVCLFWFCFCFFSLSVCVPKWVSVVWFFSDEYDYLVHCCGFYASVSFLLVYCLLRNVHTVDGNRPVGWQTVCLTTWAKKITDNEDHNEILTFFKMLKWN